MGKPGVYPTGVTRYLKNKTQNGYTLFVSALGATVIDMNGRVRKIWKDITDPAKPLPGGKVFGTRGMLPGLPGSASYIEALLLDYDGNKLVEYRDTEEAVGEDGKIIMASMHHHDFGFTDVPVYYTPAYSCEHEDGNMLLLVHRSVYDPVISSSRLTDDRIIEVDRNKTIVWEWNAYEHFQEFGLSEEARRSLYGAQRASGDWIHINAIARLGDNRFYAAGDKRFAPDNIICSSRELSEIFIIDKADGKIVWRLGPDYSASRELKEIRQIIGQHCVHMIPEGLPGAGNILLFDNGGFSCYGKPNSLSKNGASVLRRHYSRVVEIDPAELKLVWEYSHLIKNDVIFNEMTSGSFFSPYISSVQRLVNGNTLITQGSDGIVTEVTPEGEVVWEFINPIMKGWRPGSVANNVYRSYRIPYDWIPQLERPEEVEIIPPEITEYRVPGSFPLGDPLEVMTEIAD